MRKRNSLSRLSREKKSDIDVLFCKEETLPDLENDNVAQADNADNVEVEGIDVAR